MSGWRFHDRDQLHAELAETRLRLDEARAQVAAERAAYDRDTRQLEQQRDEARAEVAALRAGG